MGVLLLRNKSSGKVLFRKNETLDTEFLKFSNLVCFLIKNETWEYSMNVFYYKKVIPNFKVTKRECFYPCPKKCKI